MPFRTAITYYQTHREEYAPAFRIRMHRTVSWMIKANQLRANPDFSYLALWIAFQAAYGKAYHPEKKFQAQPAAEKFLKCLLSLDKDKWFQQSLCGKEYVRNFINDETTFQPYWDYRHRLIDEASWERAFADSQKRTRIALVVQDINVILPTVFERLATLYCQVARGGTVAGSRNNRQQMQDAGMMMSQIVGTICLLMQQNPNLDWGDNLSYPPAVVV